MQPNQEKVVLLLLAHRAMLLGYITAIVGDAHLAEDVFQDVSLVVLKKGDALHDEGAFPAWARQVARLEALAALRRRKKHPEPLDPAVLELLDAHWRAGDAEPSAVRAALGECLRRLSPQARRLIELRYVDGLRGPQVAEHLARPLNTVYVALSRTYRFLGGCIRRRLACEGAAHE
jgi:RNA polymerase sigma factor (sigma-70 family)